MFSIIIRLKSKLFTKYLFLTNTTSCGLLLATGDILEQMHEIRKKKTKYDWMRTSRMLIVGLGMGPVNHVWYTALDRWMPGTTRNVVIKKVITDQILAAPIMCLTFFLGIGCLENKQFKEILQEWTNKFPFIYLVDCGFWPPVQIINFTYVPQKFRVIYVNSFTLIWDTFLSFSKHAY